MENCENGANSLYNVLKAYAIFDPVINYGQGMNILAAMILKNMRYMDSKGNLVYDEENSFFILIHVFDVLGYKSMFDSNLSKTHS